MKVCCCSLAGTRHCLTCSNYSPLIGEWNKMNFQEWREYYDDTKKYTRTYTSTTLKEIEKSLYD